MTGLHALFGQGGALARALEGFVSRPSQRRMAERIETALSERETLLVEAGTGTGKTFAYLVPALRSGLRVLISTGTRTLQDQLYARDLPLLSGALGRPAHIALLKGRANYLCRSRLPALSSQGSLLPGAATALLSRIVGWLASTRSGDLSELRDFAETDPLRAQLTSTRESCTGSRCSEFSRCHVFAARRAALEADIVVVNHHLLMADLALKEDGFGDLLPSVDALILDEAHQLPDLAAEFFGVGCSSRQFELLLQDVRRELTAAQVPPRDAQQIAHQLEQPLRELIASLGRGERRIAWQDLERQVLERSKALRTALQAFAQALDELDAGAEIAQCALRARGLAQAMEQIADPALAEGARAAVVTARGFQLSLLPYDISARFRALVQQRRSAWIFTSATLAVAGDFAHFSRRLGLHEAATLCVESPFDYERQALLYLPTGMPDPAAQGYGEAVLQVAVPLIEAAGGGAFLLFTSHRALAAAARTLREHSEMAGRELLVQGAAPREQLLRRFRESGRAVLLGTASFWEGVDVQGAALRLVLIDKLPFGHIDDPQVRARVEYLQSQGGNPFRDYQLPEAALALKQGVGRLIRSEEDRGVVVICDPRLTTRGYGRSLLASLPPMRVTREAEAATAMLRRCASDLQPPMHTTLPAATLPA